MELLLWQVIAFSGARSSFLGLCLCSGGGVVEVLAPDVVFKDGGMLLVIVIVITVLATALIGAVVLTAVEAKLRPPGILAAFGGVPVVLDGVLSAAWDAFGDLSPPVADLLVSLHQYSLLFLAPAVLLFHTSHDIWNQKLCERQNTSKIRSKEAI